MNFLDNPIDQSNQIQVKSLRNHNVVCSWKVEVESRKFQSSLKIQANGLISMPGVSILQSSQVAECGHPSHVFWFLMAVTNMCQIFVSNFRSF